MAVVSILIANGDSNGVIAPRPRSPQPPVDPVAETSSNRMSLMAGSLVFGCPLAPREMTFDGYESDWQEQTRPGRKSLLVDRAPKLHHMSFSLLIAYPSRYTLIQSSLDKLAAICQSSNPITIRYDANTALCTWRCTSMSVTVVERHEDTNAPTRATVELEFTEYVKAV